MQYGQHKNYQKQEKDNPFANQTERQSGYNCSSKGNLNFNCLLMLAPTDVLDYVVEHKLCHRKEMNHSLKFWAEVRKVLPDYEKQKLWLKEHGDEIMMRMLGEIV